MSGFWTWLLAFTLATGATFGLSRRGGAWGPMAHPNERSLHERPTPASGGLGIAAGLVPAWVILAWVSVARLPSPWLYAGALLVAAVSLWDDWRPLPAWVRLAAHGLAAGTVLLAGLAPRSMSLPGWTFSLPLGLALLLTLLFVAWMVNLYNFMDGMDGFAGGMAVFGFGGYAMLGFIGGDTGFAMTSGAVALAAAGFLAFNFPPARIFMGDVGASTLGFLAAVFALWGARLGLFNLVAALLLFSPFIVDATVTLLRRLLRGERVWQAHREHYYQRLVRLGWGHRKTVLWEYAIMALALISALGWLGLPPLGQWGLLLGWLGLYPTLAWQVARWENRASG